MGADCCRSWVSVKANIRIQQSSKRRSISKETLLKQYTKRGSSWNNYISALLRLEPILAVLILMGYLLHSRWASAAHDDVIKWKYFPRYRPFVRRIHRSLVNSLHKGKWRGALTFLWICAWTNSWANNGDAGDLKRHRAYYDVIVMEDVFFMARVWGISCWDHVSDFRTVLNLYHFTS